MFPYPPPRARCSSNNVTSSAPGQAPLGGGRTLRSAAGYWATPPQGPPKKPIAAPPSRIGGRPEAPRQDLLLQKPTYRAQARDLLRRDPRGVAGEIIVQGVHHGPVLANQRRPQIQQFCQHFDIRLRPSGAQRQGGQPSRPAPVSRMSRPNSRSGSSSHATDSSGLKQPSTSAMIHLIAIRPTGSRVCLRRSSLARLLNPHVREVASKKNEMEACNPQDFS